MNAILIGLPGVGKGTQAKVLEERIGLKHIASGDLLRQHMRRETKLGLLARSHVHRGNLVPDEVVISMILDRISTPDCARGVLFDGFPRTCEQARSLADALAARHQAVDKVLFLVAPRDIVLKRIAGRLTCGICQAPFNMYFTPPLEDGFCDFCGGRLYRRTDDNLVTARHRLDVYMQQTMPLVEHYRAEGVLHEVDGSGEVSEITARLLRALGFVAHGHHHAPLEARQVARA